MRQRLIMVGLSRDADVVTARQRARQLAALLGLDGQSQTKLATAVSEISRNAIEHGGGGQAEFTVVTSSRPQVLEISIRDQGPGLDGARSERSRGGLGIGLAGAQRLVDRCSVESDPGAGTLVTLGKLLPDHAPEVDARRLGEIADELSRSGITDATEELKRQHQELMNALQEAQRQREELEIVNRELEDTNRGVVALYAELDERAEHLKRADELKTRFLSNMSHEFRTPLNSIVALCRFLKSRTDGTLTTEQDRQVSFIQKSAESLQELVEDLLDLAKVAAGKTMIRPAEFRLSEMFSALRGMLRPLLVASSVELVFDDVSGLPPVYGDEAKVSQILRNFISNALKFTDRGEVRVSASHDEAAGTIRLSVRDTGIGIAPEHHDRIFEEFSQVDSPTQRRVKGTGLGLPLAKRLAELMGGAVTVESALGVGSTFSVLLPDRFRDGAIAPEDIVLDQDRAPVLVIEDNPADMLVLETMLRNSPYQLISATSSEQIRRLCSVVVPRAILLDIVGDEDVWNVVVELKRVPEFAEVPVVIVSTQQNHAKASELGVAAWVRKPVERSWLIGKLDELVRKNRRYEILIIDDDEVSRYVLRQTLAGLNATIVEAVDGPSGITAARACKPDLVLLDLDMPGMSGFDVIDKLGRDAATAHIPVIIVSSVVLTPRDRERLQRATALIRKDELDGNMLARVIRTTAAGERS